MILTLLIGLLFTLPTPSAQPPHIPGCVMAQVVDPAKPLVVWHITLTRTDGHRFTIIQTKNSFDVAVSVCKNFLKAENAAARKAANRK